MIQWVVYDHPLDFPDGYLARCWLISGGGMMDTGRTLTAPTLDELRDLVRTEFPSGHRLPRFPNDDPTIVEVWL